MAVGFAASAIKYMLNALETYREDIERLVSDGGKKPTYGLAKFLESKSANFGEVPETPSKCGDICQTKS